MNSYGPPHMAKQKQDDQLKHTYSSYVRIQDVALLKTCQRRWMIGRSGERGSEISVLVARHDDDDIYSSFLFMHVWFKRTAKDANMTFFVKSFSCFQTRKSNSRWNKCRNYLQDSSFFLSVILVVLPTIFKNDGFCGIQRRVNFHCVRPCKEWWKPAFFFLFLSSNVFNSLNPNA